jgi:phosphoglucomutase
MTPQKIIDYAKKNGLFATLVFLSFLYINKLETRLEKVEQRLYNCYTQKYVSKDFNKYEMPLPSQIIAILPKETKIESYGKRKNQKVA